MSALENWLPVVGFERLYEVSDRGRVRSLSRIVNVAAAGRAVYTISIRGQILKAAPRPIYPSVTLWRNGKRRDVFVSTLVAEAFLGPAPENSEVAHLNGPADCSSGALAFHTRAEIEERKRERGTNVSGERTPWSRLRAEDVRLIRDNPQRFSQRALARQFGLTQSRISKIKLRKQWKDID